MFKRRTLLCAVIVAVVIAGCSGPKQPTELPFTSLGQANFFTARFSEAVVFVAATPREGDELATIMQSDVGDKLLQLDYDTQFALLVVRQSLGSSGHSATVQRVIRQDDHVRIEAVFSKPAPDEPVRAAFTEPHDLVTINKDGGWGRPITFDLVVDNQVIATTTHMIP